MPQISLLPVVNGQIRHDMQCVACDLSQNPNLHTNRMSGVGSENPVFFFVGHAPGAEDDFNGKPMTGKNGRLLHDLLRHAGIPYSKCYFTNTLKCALYGQKPKEMFFKHCRDWLIDEINERKPIVIISAGAQAMKWLTGQSGVSKLRRRGLPCALPIHKDALVFPIRQPAALFHTEGYEYQQLFDEMVSDLVWIRQQVEHGIVHRAGDIETDYDMARTEDDADRILTELESADLLACDLETGTEDFEKALFPYSNCHIISVGFSTRVGHARAIPLYARGISSPFHWREGFVEKTINPRLKAIFEQKQVFGHNFLSFDQKWIRKEFGIDYCNIDFDTILAHYILNEERGTHALELLALLYTTMAPWKSTFTLSDTEQMCQYLCRDVDATFRLRSIFEPQLNDLQKWLLKNILMPVSNVLMEVEYEGVGVSKDNLYSLRDHLTEKIQAARDELQKSKPVQEFQIDKNVKFNPASPHHVRELLTDYCIVQLVKRTDSGEYSVDKEVLEDLSGEFLEADCTLKIRKLEKLKSTYCDGLIKVVDDAGRVHTSYSPYGTVSGRLASSNPNLMNLPRADTVGEVLEDGSIIKSVFAARPGYLFLQADYSQVELRVLACLSGDAALTEIYQKGLDAHTATAARVYGIPLDEVTKTQRTNSKTVNFGIVYGMSYASLLEKFLDAGNTEEQAENFYKAHQRTFRGVWKYMREQEQIARRQRFQETPFGRRRRYEDITSAEVRMAYNFPIQSTASDLTLLSIIRCHQILKKFNIDARIVLTVHDSIVFEIAASQFLTAARIIKLVMEGVKFDWLTVPIVVDLEYGPNWGKLENLENFKNFPQNVFTKQG